MRQNKVAKILTSIFSNDYAGEGGAGNFAQHREGEKVRASHFEDMDSVLCHTDDNELTAYVEAELNGQPVAALYPELKQALDECENCHTAYLELKELLQLVQKDELVEPAAPATFDFSYLKRATAAPPPISTWEQSINHVTWRLLNLKKLVVSLSDDFIQSLQTPSLQATTLKSVGDDLFQLVSPAMAPDMAVTISARAKRRQPDRYVIGIDVQIPSRGGWPNLGGSSVTLLVDGQAVETRETDAFGKVLFDGVGHADLAQVELWVEAAP